MEVAIMELRNFTDPFAGIDFTVVAHDDEIRFMHPITNETVTAHLDGETLSIPLSAFERVETMNVKETCDTLEISRQRLSQLVANDILIPFYIGDSQHFRTADILEYKQNRKTGRPRKQ